MNETPVTGADPTGLMDPAHSPSVAFQNSYANAHQVYFNKKILQRTGVGRGDIFLTGMIRTIILKFKTDGLLS